MNFVHLATADHGGAGSAVVRLHQGLRDASHASRIVVLDKRSHDTDIIEAVPRWHPFRLKRFAYKAGLRIFSRRDYFFAAQHLSCRVDLASLPATRGACDVIVVHAISNFLSFEDVFRFQASTGAPVIWHLPDMAALTGGCHYAWGCVKFEAECSMCPALRMSSRRDLSNRIWDDKAEYATRIAPAAVIAASSTLLRQAAASRLFGTIPIAHILLGIPVEVFYPRERAVVRRSLAMDPERLTLFFGAQHMADRRKGIAELRQALHQLAMLWPPGRQLPALLIAGDATEFHELEQLGFAIKALGYIGQADLALAYTAADVFACPSLEDSGPMMINESMMSGTPVVAFQMGVAPDLIEPGVTGDIVELGNVPEFARALLNVLEWSPEKRSAAQARCRERALELCHPRRQIERVVELASSLLAQKPSLARAN